LQVTVAALCLVPISAGAAGLLLGPEVVGAVHGQTDLDSHFRYLSGIFLGVGLGFLWTVPAIESRTTVFRLLTACVVMGGLGRLLSLVLIGPPTLAHLVGLVLELVVVPLLAVWQSRVARGDG
jgi:hypothetical protein